MKNTLYLALSFALVCGSMSAFAKSKDSTPVEIPMAPEDWKGPSEKSVFSLGAMGGLGIIDGAVGGEAVATIAGKIVPKGFVPDINDNVWVEAYVGPWFGNLGTAVLWSAHMRWDFIKDEQWAVYALCGVGGDYLTFVGGIGSRVEIYPRLAIGGLLKLTPFVSLRGEFSHDFIGAGVALSM